MPRTSQQTFLQPDGANPAVGAALVTPNDATDLPNGPCRALYIGVTGNINIDTPQGDTILFSNVPVGILPVGAKRVRVATTTATLIIALY